MRSFEEYIGQASLLESRQNYIFGGTDDRNTNVVMKTFGELEEGDVFYFWNKNMGETAKERYFSVKTEGPTYSNLYYNSNGDFTVIQTKQLNDSFVLPSKISIDAGSLWCIATTFEELQEVVKETFGVDVKNFMHR